MKKFLLLMSMFVLSTCTNTGPIKVGEDTYTISTRVAFSGAAGAKGDALQEAAKFCRSQHKEMLLTESKSNECALHGGCGEAEIYFYCLASDDPQYTRLKINKKSKIKLEVESE